MFGDLLLRATRSRDIRALATYVDELVFDTGVTRVETAGDVGDSVLRATPKWRGTLSATYEDANVGFDIRARFKIDDRFMLFGNVNNVFDRDPPLITANSTLYDVVGRYFTVGARVDF